MSEDKKQVVTGSGDKGGDSRPDLKELAAYANRGERPAYPLTAYEWLFWYECRDVYQDWRNKSQDEDKLRERKHAAVQHYERAKREDAELSEVTSRIANFWKKVEEAANDYRLARNDADRLDAADKMMCVVYGLLGGE